MLFNYIGEGIMFFMSLQVANAVWIPQYEISGVYPKDKCCIFTTVVALPAAKCCFYTTV
jgi:hypothetical protein